MPTPHAHRIALAATLAAAVLLAGLMALGALHYRDAAKRTSSVRSLAEQRVLLHQRLAQGSVRARPGVKPKPTAASTASALASARAARRSATSARSAPAPPPTRAIVKLVASRGDCWTEVRKGSESGDVLFSGILARGQVRTFRGKQLWIRLGAPESVDVSLAGKPAEIPKGTLNVLATPRGLSAAA